MSQDDVLVILPEEFYKLCTPCCKVNPLVKNILEKECFDDKKAVEIYNQQFKSRAPQVKKTHHFQKREPINKGICKTEREIMGCLNILNTSNRIRVSQRMANVLKFASDTDNILNLILQKAIMNTPYMYLYIDVMDEIAENTPKVKSLFIDNYVNSFDGLISAISGVNYEEDFCTFNKLKKNIINNHLCLVYVKQHDDEFLLKYFNILIQCFKVYDQMYIRDMLVYMVQSLVGKRKNGLMAQLFVDMCLEKTFYNSCNTKTKFAMDDFMQGVLS